MKNPIKFVLLVVLPVMVVLTLAGCSEGPIDGHMYNPIGWEKLMKDPDLNKTDFTRLYALATAARFQGCEVFINGKLKLTLKLYDGKELKVPLDSIWAETVKDPANRPAICRRHIAEFAASNTADGALEAHVDKSTILPVIWSGPPPENGKTVYAVTANGVQRKFLRDTNQFVVEPLAGDIHILYFGDRDGTDIYLTEADRKLLLLDLPALHKLAVENLTDRLPGIILREPAPPFTISVGGKYAASLLLDDKLWDKQASAVRGDLVAAVPADNLLIFTGTDSPGGVEALRKKVQQIYGTSGSDAISKMLLVRRNGKWEAFNGASSATGKSLPGANLSSPSKPK